MDKSDLPFMHSKFPVETAIDLAALLGTSEGYLWHLGKKAQESYNYWKEPKKNSSDFRFFSCPKPQLKTIQKKLHALLFKKIIYSQYSHYGLKKKSSITNAREHIGSIYILTRDLKSFFPSIRPERISTALINELGCPKQVATLITKLVTVKYELPQGAPTSTDMANLVTYRLQRRLAKLTKQWGLNNFTIYADDITFSGDNIPSGFKVMVRKIIEAEGFKINSKKGGQFDKSKSQIVTGVNIAHGASVGKVRKQWRAEHHKNEIKFRKGEISIEELKASENKLNGRKAYSGSVKRIAAFHTTR